jgi:hypothetical protein
MCEDYANHYSVTPGELHFRTVSRQALHRCGHRAARGGENILWNTVLPMPVGSYCPQIGRRNLPGASGVTRVNQESSGKEVVVARIVGIAIVLALLASSLASILSGKSLVRSPEGIRLLLVRDWAIAAVLIAIGLLWERQQLSSLGIYPPAWRDLRFGVAGFVIGLLAFAVSGKLVQAGPRSAPLARGLLTALLPDTGCVCWLGV